MHSIPAEQKAPFGLRPQEFWTHTFPGEHAGSLPLPLQEPKQRAPLQTYGVHPMASGARQLPFVSQVETGV